MVLTGCARKPVSDLEIPQVTLPKSSPTYFIDVIITKDRELCQKEGAILKE